MRLKDLLTGENNVSIRYEILSMYALENKSNPNTLSDVGMANTYERLFIPEVTPKGYETLVLILDKLIARSVQANERTELLALRDSLDSRISEQATANSLINYIIEVLE